MRGDLVYMLGEQGPMTAGQTLRLVSEWIAIDAVAGMLPDEETKAAYWAAHEGLLAGARYAVERGVEHARWTS